MALLTALEAVFTALPAVLIAVFATFIAELAVFIAAFVALAGFAFALLAAPSPQAMPKALSTKSVESPIIFFISKLILLSSSKLNLILVTSVGRQTLPQTSDFLGTLVNIMMNPALVNPKSVENHR